MSESKDSVKRRIIGLYSPEPQSGKSTIAKRLREKHKFVRVSFASPIKHMVWGLLGCLGYAAEECEAFLWGDRKEEIIPSLGVTPRFLKQTLGTEWGRELVREDLWTRVAKANIDRIAPDASFVIDDVRTIGEARLVRDMGGEVVQVLRPERPEPTDGAVLKHSTEGALAGWPFDNTLLAQEGIEALHDMADSLMEEHEPADLGGRIDDDGWEETFTGEMVNVIRPDPATIRLEDIAVALAKQCRYNGHCEGHFSVAEHSDLVSRVLERESRRLAILGLVHDAGEAYGGDIVRGVKRRLSCYAAIEAGLMSAIYEALGIDPPTEAEAVKVKAADNAVGRAEAAKLMTSHGDTWGYDVDPADVEIRGFERLKAKTRFLTRCAELGVGQ